MSGDEGFGPVLRGGPRSGPVVRRGGGKRRAPDDSRAPADRRDGGRGRGDGPAREPSRPRRPDSARPDVDGYGPAERGRGTRRPRRGRTRRRRSLGRRLLTVLLVLALLVLTPAIALAAYASSQIDRRDIEHLTRAPGIQMNVLVVGSDSREGLTREEISEFSTGRAEGGRADTVMLLAVRGPQAAMLSIPRDLLVTRCDGSQGRLNAAFNIDDGRSCLVETVSRTTGIPVSHYLELNMGSFVQLVDAVGGVEVCLEQAIRDHSAAIDLPAGCQELDRGEALGFVRARQVDDDFGRQGRQQYFVQQLAKEIASPSTLLNPARLFETAQRGGQALIADRRFGTFDLMHFGLGARGIAGAPSYKIPAVPQSLGGAAVLAQREAEAQPIYQAFRDGSVFRNPPEQPDI